jgi:hypothetical protein
MCSTFCAQTGQARFARHKAGDIKGGWSAGADVPNGQQQPEISIRIDAGSVSGRIFGIVRLMGLCLNPH